MTLSSSLALFASFMFYSFSINSVVLWVFVVNLAAFLVTFNLFLLQYRANYRSLFRKEIEEEVKNNLAFARIDSKRKNKVIDV